MSIYKKYIIYEIIIFLVFVDREILNIYSQRFRKLGVYEVLDVCFEGINLITEFNVIYIILN